MKTTLFYFSGTGNTLQVAKDLAAEIGNTRIIPISKALKHRLYPKFDNVGIVFPVYNMDMPQMVSKYISKLLPKKHKFYFAVCTYGAMLGGTLKKTKKMLGKNGITLSGGFAVKMPANAVIAYDVCKKKTCNKLLEKEKSRVKQIAAIVRKRKKCRVDGFPFFINIMLEPIKVLFDKLFLKNFDEKFKVDEKCNSCGICASVCPSGNLRMDAGKPVWLHKNCQYCLACLNWCPQQVIQYGSKTRTHGRYQNPHVRTNELFRD